MAVAFATDFAGVPEGPLVVQRQVPVEREAVLIQEACGRSIQGAQYCRPSTVIQPQRGQVPACPQVNVLPARVARVHEVLTRAFCPTMPHQRVPTPRLEPAHKRDRPRADPRDGHRRGRTPVEVPRSPVPVLHCFVATKLDPEYPGPARTIRQPRGQCSKPERRSGATDQGPTPHAPRSHHPPGLARAASRHLRHPLCDLRGPGSS
jgi:hypothetical protein